MQLLDAEQLRAVFAHEAGHVLSDHVLYRTALVILLRLTALPGIPLPLFPLRAALMEWFRAAELSCDRAAALVTRDPLAVCRTLMVIAAGAEAANLDLDVFMQQGQEYREKGSPFDRLSRLLVDLNLTHPMPVQRVHELMEWVEVGRLRPHRRRRVHDPRRAAAARAPRRATPSRTTPSASATRSGTSASRSTTPASSSATGCERRATATAMETGTGTAPSSRPRAHRAAGR